MVQKCQISLKFLIGLEISWLRQISTFTIQRWSKNVKFLKKIQYVWNFLLSPNFNFHRSAVVKKSQISINFSMRLKFLDKTISTLTGPLWSKNQISLKFSMRLKFVDYMKFPLSQYSKRPICNCSFLCIRTIDQMPWNQKSYSLIKVK